MFASYPEYSVIQNCWADKLPSQWRVASLRWMSTIYAGGTPDKNNTDYWEEGTIPWINSGAVNQHLVSYPSTLITEEGFKNSSAKWIPRGSLVMALAGQGKTKGMVAQLAIDTTCNQSMAAIVPERKLSSRYLYWWLSSNYQNIRNMAGGDLRDGLNLELLGSISTPIPSQSEQTQIARFLDYETARIDALIEEQQRLIVLLKEKRQAVISHAVTLGLDLNVPMKDSRVEWLGEVPEYWNVKPLKFVATVTGRIGFRGYTTDDIVDEGEGAITISPSNMIEGSMNYDKVTFISWEKYEESPEIKLNLNDVLIVKTGSTFGRTAFVDNLPEPATINPQLAIFKDISIDNKYLYYLFESSYLKACTKNSNTGGTMPTMTQETIGNYKIPVPPEKEQAEIVSSLNLQVKSINNLILLAIRNMELERERRSALISAAVTGKIDVRNWQPPTDKNKKSTHKEAAYG